MICSIFIQLFYVILLQYLHYVNLVHNAKCFTDAGNKKSVIVVVLEEYSLRARHKQDRAKIYPLIPQAAVLPGSDAGSDGVESASDFVIQNRRTSYLAPHSEPTNRFSSVMHEDNFLIVRWLQNVSNLSSFIPR